MAADDEGGGVMVEWHVRGGHVRGEYVRGGHEAALVSEGMAEADGKEMSRRRSVIEAAAAADGRGAEFGVDAGSAAGIIAVY